MLEVGASTELDKVEEILETDVELDRRGMASKILGIELTWLNKQEVLLTQHAYIENLTRLYLSVHNIDRYKPKITITFEKSYFTTQQ